MPNDFEKPSDSPMTYWILLGIWNRVTEIQWNQCYGNKLKQRAQTLLQRRIEFIWSG